MTIDEAIEHAKRKAQQQRYYANFEKNLMRKVCVNCAEEHEQLAEWLEELKCYRNDNDFSEYADKLYKTAYNKAIEDFVEKLMEYCSMSDMNQKIIKQISKKLKKEV